MLSTTLVLYVILTGLGFSLMSVAYRVGQRHGVPVPVIGLMVSLCGSAYFLILTWGNPPWNAPPLVWAFGVAVGLTQCVLTHCVYHALRRGPLSPTNCALFLGFVLLILFSWLVWDETMSVLQIAGVATAVVCILFASLQHGNDEKEEHEPHSRRDWAIYAGLLAALVMLNAFANGIMKYLAMTPEAGAASLADRFGDQYLTTLYVSIAIGIAIDLRIRRTPFGPRRWVLGTGLTAGAGSILGMSLLRRCAVLPASFNFPVIAMTVLLSGALVAVLFFGERTSRAWWGMIIAGGAAAALLIIDALLAIAKTAA